MWQKASLLHQVYFTILLFGIYCSSKRLSDEMQYNHLHLTVVLIHQHSTEEVFCCYNLSATKMNLFCSGWLSWSKLRSADCFKAVCLRLCTISNLGFFLNLQKISPVFNFLLTCPLLHLYICQRMVACFLCTMHWKSWEEHGQDLLLMLLISF